MTYNFPSFPRVGSCIPTHTACITDPRYHHNFGSHYHNHFNSHCHDHFYPCCDELELNIQLPDVKCPDIPSCPDVKCPDIPACPEPKKPIDFSKLSIVVDAVSGEIKDAKTKESTGFLFQKCREIIDKTDNNLEIGPNNRIQGQCYSNSECKDCVDAINSSIIDVRTESAFSPEKISEPEHIVYFI